MFKPNLKSKLIVAVMVIIGITAFMSCNKDSEQIGDNPSKETITIDNLGEVHNFLLAEYEKANLKSESNSKTFGDVYNRLEKLLINSDKYSVNSTIASSLSESEKQVIFDSFADIKLDTNFQKEFEKRFLIYFQSLTNIDENIKLIMLNTIQNYSSINNSNDLENYSDNDLVLAYNNVYNSSMDYWSKKGKLKSANMSENQAIVWADAAGAAIGLGCGGLMSILMGAAASNMVIECHEIN